MRRLIDLDAKEPYLLDGRYFIGIPDNVSAVKRPQGEWIDYSDEGYVECPFCQSATNCEDNKDELHYCFNCGARMKGGAE